MELEILHPVIANISCEMCQKYVHDAETYKLIPDRDGKPDLRGNYGGASIPNCRTSKGCPKGTPENQRSLNERNRICLEHFRESQCNEQVGDESEACVDATTRRNAAIIREVQEECRRIERQREHIELIQLVALKGVTNGQ